MKKVYIAGPMSGLPDFNRPAFRAVAEFERRAGKVALNPAILPDGLSQPEYMAICLPMVMMADEVLLLDGWELSAGARAEKALAEKCGIPTVTVEDRYLSEFESCTTTPTTP